MFQRVADVRELLSSRVLADTVLNSVPLPCRSAMDYLRILIEGGLPPSGTDQAYQSQRRCALLSIKGYVAYTTPRYRQMPFPLVRCIERGRMKRKTLKRLDQNRHSTLEERRRAEDSSLGPCPRPGKRAALPQMAQRCGSATKTASDSRALPTAGGLRLNRQLPPKRVTSQLPSTHPEASGAKIYTLTVTRRDEDEGNVDETCESSIRRVEAAG